MSHRARQDSPTVVAALGPTNTGKTHRAIERMLEYPTGMMGLPLRLLAREVYDRVSARVGEARVALVTGEEKRVPPRADYWVCTVEAMPLGKRVDFLAVDEIQLAANRERGHIFTDRLLYARGRSETWFLGAETMRGIVQALVPGVTFKQSPRLSQLRSFGRRSLKSLPARSAVVAFSVDRVYELAESLRRLRGGVAVVLGALSPRTRNAQVAMYQAGEVQHLVATDAIGMGLNLDLHHVAFAGLSKYDGYEQRELTVEELAQIAGRAGRHLNDGFFGTLNPLPELPPHVVSSIENHRFRPVRSLFWRNPSLDFSSPEALLDSLAAPPPAGPSADGPRLQRIERADDFDALRELTRIPEVRRTVTDSASVERLWAVCQIPDFRKLLFGQHVSLLREVYLQLTDGDGRLDDDWLARQVAPLEDRLGDIDTLMARLASIRVWTYISNHSGWVRSPERWQERTRHIEDILGDTLHERLVERFVERAARRTPRRRAEAVSAVRADNPFGKLRLAIDATTADAELTVEALVQRTVDAAHEEFQVDASGRISFHGELLARLIRGNDVRSPQVALAEPEVWTAGERRQLERRMTALAKDIVREAMGGWAQESPGGPDASAEARGLTYRLSQGLGVVAWTPDVVDQWNQLSPDVRRRFMAAGAREGLRYLYVADALEPSALERRCLLAAVHEQHPAPTGSPTEPWLPRGAFVEAEEALYAYEGFGPLAVRFDVVEKLARVLRGPAPRQAAQVYFDELGLEPSARARLLTALGVERRRRPRGRRRRRSA